MILSSLFVGGYSSKSCKESLSLLMNNPKGLSEGPGKTCWLKYNGNLSREVQNSQGPIKGQVWEEAVLNNFEVPTLFLPIYPSIYPTYI